MAARFIPCVLRAQTAVDALPQAAEAQCYALEGALAKLRGDVEALAQRCDGAASHDAVQVHPLPTHA